MQPLSGFRDFLPASCAERNYIFAKWREVAGRYGFVEFDGPVLEELDLYKKKSGDEIVRQLYEFVDKGERAVALRPEMTPTLARIVAAEHRQFRKPLSGSRFRRCFVTSVRNGDDCASISNSTATSSAKNPRKRMPS